MADIDVVTTLLVWAIAVFWSSMAIGRKSIVSSIFAAITWFTMAQVNVIMAATGTYVTAWLGLSWMYYGFGTTFTIVTIVYAIMSLLGKAQGKELEREQQELEVF